MQLAPVETWVLFGAITFTRRYKWTWGLPQYLNWWHEPIVFAKRRAEIGGLEL